MKVGYQGGSGAYSHIAARRCFPPNEGATEYVGCESFSAMLTLLTSGELDFALLPIENSIAGSIHENYDLLAANDVTIVGEVYQPIAHCLIGLQNASLSGIRYVFSHPVALAQCRAFLLSMPNCHAEAFVDTALAVQKVRDDNDPSHAAIAAEEAAAIYGMHVLKGHRRSVGDYTRMVIVAARDHESNHAGNTENFTRYFIAARARCSSTLRECSCRSRFESHENRIEAEARVTVRIRVLPRL
ncbi:MAG: prephenate dehydratase domain-containing protein [Polyangiales bacterium]